MSDRIDSMSDSSLLFVYAGKGKPSQEGWGMPMPDEGNPGRRTWLLETRSKTRAAACRKWTTCHASVVPQTRAARHSGARRRQGRAVSCRGDRGDQRWHGLGMAQRRPCRTETKAYGDSIDVLHCNSGFPYIKGTRGSS